MTATTRPARIPPPIVQMPACPLCDIDLEHDGDTLVCESCAVRWIDDTSEGYRSDDEPACDVEHRPWVGYAAIGDHRYRCVLAADHEGEHRGVRCDVVYDSENVHVWPVTA